MDIIQSQGIREVEVSRIYKNGDIVGPYNSILLQRLENRKGLFKCGYCSNTYIAFISNVARGTKKSCGCQNKHYKAGDKLGPNNILLIKYTFRDKHRKWHGLFECPYCKKQFETEISNITTSNTTSCGCYKKESSSKRLHESNPVDLTGKRSGDWTFIKRLDKQSKNGTWYWLCKCDNGHTNEIMSSNFGRIKNCLKCHPKLSHGERKIAELLESLNISFIREKSFEDCKNINLLPFDFYLPDYNCCIEYDGEQHFYKNIFSHEDFELRKKRDKIKNQYCEKNKIKLIRIPYWDYDNLDANFLLQKIKE